MADVKDIKKGGHYYILEKKSNGLPTEITVISEELDERRKVQIEYGHVEVRENCDYDKRKRCKVDDILQYEDLTAKQKGRLEKKRKEIEEKEKIVYEILDEFDVKIPYISWMLMDTRELNSIQRRLRREKKWN